MPKNCDGGLSAARTTHKKCNCSVSMMGLHVLTSITSFSLLDVFGNQLDIILLVAIVLHRG